ncbi:MAG: ATP-binding protein [Candidatus Zixiibacteriota bacterium]
MNAPVTISIASGKGGTGKTTLATNLALVLANRGEPVTYIDCDVEEPDGHIFLQPDIDRRIPVNVMIPQVDLTKCTFCGKCSGICEYNALAVLNDKVMVFPSLCHSCGGCVQICPEQAIEEIPRTIGSVNSGTGRGVTFFEGRLDIGEALAPPITRQLRKNNSGNGITIIDAPPGTSCPVIEAVKETDFLILVTEPTPFGLNDLKLAVEMSRALGLPIGVVVNRSDAGDERVENYCRDEHIDILLRIPFDRRFARAYSDGRIFLAEYPEYDKKLFALFQDITKRINRDGTGHTQR